MGRNVAARSLEFTGIRLALRKPLIMPTGGLDQPNNADGADGVVITNASLHLENSSVVDQWLQRYILEVQTDRPACRRHGWGRLCPMVMR